LTEGTTQHALLWNGTPGSAVDLNPAVLGLFSSSMAVGTNGMQQVGHGIGGATAGATHALGWGGTAASAVGLQPFLTAAFFFDPGDGYGSEADTIDANGNIFGVAFDKDVAAHAIEWVPVPEPSMPALGLAVSAAFGFLPRRRS